MIKYFLTVSDFRELYANPLLLPPGYDTLAELISLNGPDGGDGERYHDGPDSDCD